MHDETLVASAWLSVCRAVLGVEQIFSAMLSGLLPSRHTPPHTPTVDNPLSPRSAEAKGLTTRLLKHTETEDLLSEPRVHSTSGSGGLRRSMSSTVESSGRDKPKPPRKQASMGAMGALLRQVGLISLCTLKHHGAESNVSGRWSGSVRAVEPHAPEPEPRDVE